MLAPDAPMPVIETESAQPELSRFSADVLIVTWDLAGRVSSSPQLQAQGVDRIAPLASLRLPLRGGGTRLLWTLKRPKIEGVRLLLSAGPLGPQAEINLDAEGTPGAVDAERLLDGLAPTGRISLVTTLLNTWSGLFRLNRSRSFLRVLDDLLGALTVKPLPAHVVASANDTIALIESTASAALGEVVGMHLVSPDSARRLRGRMHVAGRAATIVADLGPVPAKDAWLILIGAGGIAIRRFGAPKRLPSLVQWWQNRRPADPRLRERIVAALAELSPAGRAAALEFQMRCALPARRVTGTPGGMPTSEIDLALTTASGVLVGGWFQDPNGFVDGVDLLEADGSARQLDDVLRRFPGSLPAENGAMPAPATGFVAFLPGDGRGTPILQPRLRLRLTSGATHALVPPPQPFDPSAARGRALRAVPPQHLSSEVMESCLAPALADLQAAHIESVGQPTVVRIGEIPERPVASLVIPLYRTLDFLRFQVAAFASDPWIRAHAEVIYVLDSPEQAEEVEHLLGGLLLVYGLPVTLVVMERNGGYALASNTGAGFARGGLLGLINSDVVPTEPGWFGVLAAHIGGKYRVGAVGPKLLFEDGSLQHAGMYFTPDSKGSWLNHHFYKGLPRDFAPAQATRLVPAVTGACLVTPRELFERVDGFTEGYIIGDYEDSDLCLKLRAAGSEIAYVPEAELWHLERRSIRRSADYMRGAASQYNSWLHTQRWGDVMAALMAPALPAESIGKAAA